MSSHAITIEEMDRNELENELRDAYDENESLQERIKELGTELGTQLGTDQVAEAGKMVWISVKDRLPDECESVLVYDAKCNDYEIMWREEIGNEWEWTNGEYNLPDTSYTHWMPLPQSPTISKKENVATAEDSSDAGGKK